MACGLDISAGSSLPFIRGRFSGSVMSPAHRQTETLPEEPGGTVVWASARMTTVLRLGKPLKGVSVRAGRSRRGARASAP
jgi:hypothetical protein